MLAQQQCQLFIVLDVGHDLGEAALQLRERSTSVVDAGVEIEDVDGASCGASIVGRHR